MISPGPLATRVNPLRKLHEYGQSLWLDSLRRGMFITSQLQRLITDDGLLGVTSNPTIFEKAIGGSEDYEHDIRLLARQGFDPLAIYQTLAIADIRRAADLFMPVYEGLEGRDGWVSLEVSPRLAHDTQATLAEARQLWRQVDRPNILIKVPATDEGIPAIRQLLTEGISVNITLLFGLERYRQVLDAYLAAMEARSAAGQPLAVASVASFFLSRIDTLVDDLLQKTIERDGPSAERAAELQGRVAIASARTAYQIYRSMFAPDRFAHLAAAGAPTQRLLWASTSTKNPAYSDVMYVELLIGPETINTMPMETLDAYRDHGNPASRLEDDVERSRQILDDLAELGIDLADVVRQLEEKGVEQFAKSFDLLLKTLDTHITAERREGVRPHAP